MSPAIQQAFDAFFNTRYLANDVARRHAYEAFEAGWIAAIAQPEVERLTPVVSTTTAEDIYAAYPRKVGKQGAIRAIQKAAKIIGPKATSMTRFCPYEILLERTQAFAKATASWPQEERHFICHPATWFNRGSYDDDPKEWERNSAPASQFSVSH
jgi:hypothetical protein